MNNRLPAMLGYMLVLPACLCAKLDIEAIFNPYFAVPKRCRLEHRVPILYEKEQECFDAELAEESCYLMFQRFGLLAEKENIESLTIEDLIHAQRTNHALITHLKTTIDRLEQRLAPSPGADPLDKYGILLDYVLHRVVITLRKATLLHAAIAHPLSQPVITPPELIAITVRHTVAAMKGLRTSLAERGISLIQEDCTGLFVGLFYPLYIRALAATICCCWFTHNISHDALEKGLAEQTALIQRIVPSITELIAAVLVPNVTIDC